MDHVERMTNEELGAKLVNWHFQTVEARGVYANEARKRLTRQSDMGSVVEAEEAFTELLRLCGESHDRSLIGAMREARGALAKLAAINGGVR